MKDSSRPQSGPDHDVANDRSPLSVGVVVCDIKPANVAALKYLVLQLNKQQRLFEVEFLPPDSSDRLIQMLDAGTQLHTDDVTQELDEFQHRYHQYVARLSVNSYALRGSVPNRFIVISLASVTGNYYSINVGTASVLTLGSWERDMAPPSIIEFVLTMVVREATFMAVSSVDQHLGTRGCLFDFTPILEDARQRVLGGCLCTECRKAIESECGPATVEELNHTARKGWLGTLDNPHSPAAIASNLGHNLFLNKGLQPTRWEAFVSLARQEGVSQAFNVAGIVLAAVLLLVLGIQA